MKAKQLIEILQTTYKPDEEIQLPFIKLTNAPVQSSYKFRVQMIRDHGTIYETHKEWVYDNALDAATSYNAFIDHGFACCGQTIFLYEPNGQTHHKTFLTRGIDAETRERLRYTSPVLS